MEDLLEDIAYLQAEAQALRSVIDEVPSERRPSGKPSIADKLALIDYLQRSYYGDTLQRTFDEESPPVVRERKEAEASYTPGQEQPEEVQKILDSLLSYRAELVDMLEDLSFREWDTVLNRGGRKVPLPRFLREMVRFERDALREISERVMMFNREKQTRRELRQRRERQEQISDPSKPAGESGGEEQE